MHRPSRKLRIAFGVLAWGLRPPINLLMAKKWERLDRLPNDTGFIVCPNHVTEIDPVVVGHMLYNQGVMPHFLAKASLFKIPVAGAALRAAKQIPVERGSGAAQRSLDVAREVMDEGGGIIIYPEGTLTRDPDLWPMRGHTGAARLALQTGAPVVPVAHWGAQQVLPPYAKRLYLFPRKTVRVLVGEPVDLSAFAGRPLDRQTLAAATERIMAALAALVGQLRGEEPPATRWDPVAHHQTTRGRIKTMPGAERPATERPARESPGTEPVIGAAADDALDPEPLSIDKPPGADDGGVDVDGDTAGKDTAGKDNDLGNYG